MWSALPRAGCDLELTGNVPASVSSSDAGGGREGKQLPLAVEKMPTSRISRPERETLMKPAGLHWGPKVGLGQARLGG